MADTNWMNDPELAGISKDKLSFLEKLFLQSSKMTQKEMLPFLLSLSKKEKDSSTSFTKDEMKLIYRVIQKYASPDDIAKMQRFSSYFQ